MADTISNTQGQDLTTSSNGRNVIPVLKPISHFFLESGTFVQSSAQCFGAQTTSEFRTTSKVTFSGNKKVYAICKGQVFIQPQTGSTTKVNLILKPFEQPVNGLPIKYFIYRGLNKSDFFTTDAEPKITGSETTGTDFVKFIWKQFNQFYSNDDPSQTAPDFLAKSIGFSTYVDVDFVKILIDNFFFKITQYTDSEQTIEDADTAYELPIVPKGMCLGEAAAEIGIDIVLNDGDYYISNDPNPFQYDLNFARSADHKLETATTNTDYENKLIKESCTKFIDVASYYGLHANDYGKVFVDALAAPKVTVNDIYTLISGFATKNKVYLYIQSNRQRSYNFYGNYKYDDTSLDNLNIGTDENNFTTTEFNVSGWPVYEYEDGSTLTLQLLTDNNESAAMYVNIGALHTDTEHENNFLRKDNILQQQDETGTIDLSYIKPISFVVQSSNTNAISAFIQLIYNGKHMVIEEYVDPSITPAPDPFYHTLKDIDDVFGMIDACAFFDTKNSMELSFISDQNLSLINFHNLNSDTDNGVVKIIKINDLVQTVDEQTYTNRVTYETVLSNIRLVSSAYLKHASGSIDNVCSGTAQYDVSINNFYQPRVPYYYEIETFINSINVINGIKLQVADGGVPTKKILGLTEVENQLFKDVVIANNLINSKFFFHNLLDNESDEFVSAEQSTYKIYSLKIISEDLSGNPKVYCPTTEVLIYTMDRYVFFTKNYSTYMSIESSNEFTILELL